MMPRNNYTYCHFYNRKDREWGTMPNQLGNIRKLFEIEGTKNYLHLLIKAMFIQYPVNKYVLTAIFFFHCVEIFNLDLLYYLDPD